VRLFVAIEVNDAVRKLAAQARRALEEAGVAGRFELDDKLHLTLAFLGEVDEARVAHIKDAIRALAGATPFSLDFDRLGAFPNPRRPHTIWLRSRRVPGAFIACGQGVRTQLSRLGFRFEHPLEPHVTVCRPKQVHDLVLPEIEGTARLHVESVTLFQSLPAGQTTRYEAIDRTAFAAQR
jgi:2'-5' RNA ligase